jgi:hypothetical protein
MTEPRLFLVSANKSRSSAQWSDDDYDVRDGTATGRVIGRIYKLSVAPTGKWWWWRLMLFPAMTTDRGTAETRDARWQS